MRYLSLLSAVLLLSLLAFFSCVDDKENDSELEELPPEPKAARGTDWGDTCQDFLDDYAGVCPDYPFGMTEADALDSCSTMGDDIPWYCAIYCWKLVGDCFLWVNCLDSECDYHI